VQGSQLFRVVDALVAVVTDEVEPWWGLAPAEPAPAPCGGQCTSTGWAPGSSLGAPLRRSRPLTTAPAAKMAAAHQKAVV